MPVQLSTGIYLDKGINKMINERQLREVIKDVIYTERLDCNCNCYQPTIWNKETKHNIPVEEVVETLMKRIEDLEKTVN